jgi:hypothetical protein
MEWGSRGVVFWKGDIMGVLLGSSKIEGQIVLLEHREHVNDMKSMQNNVL